MRLRILTIAVLAACLAGFVVASSAQKAPQNQDHAGSGSMGPMQDQNNDQGMKGMSGMTGMTGMMGNMPAHHQEMKALMSKLMASMTAIQNEKDPEALKTKLADHQALLKQMQTHMMQQEKMMHMMSDQTKAGCTSH